MILSNRGTRLRLGFFSLEKKHLSSRLFLYRQYRRYQILKTKGDVLNSCVYEHNNFIYIINVQYDEGESFHCSSSQVNVFPFHCTAALVDHLPTSGPRHLGNLFFDLDINDNDSAFVVLPLRAIFWYMNYKSSSWAIMQQRLHSKPCGIGPLRIRNIRTRTGCHLVSCSQSSLRAYFRKKAAGDKGLSFHFQL